MCWRPTRRRPSKACQIPARAPRRCPPHRLARLRRRSRAFGRAICPQKPRTNGCVGERVPLLAPGDARPAYFVLVVVGLLAAVAAVPGAILPLPLASTALQAVGS